MKRWGVSVCILLILVLCFAIPLGAKKKKKISLEFDKALKVFIPYVQNDSLQNPVVYFRHICCDCALTHDVVLEVTEEGIVQYWWRNPQQTRIRRIMKGLDPWDSGPGGKVAPWPPL